MNFFWKLATLIDVMLLDHWIEMTSVMGVSHALEKLARLIPSEAHRLTDGGDVEEVPVEELRHVDCWFFVSAFAAASLLGLGLLWLVRRSGRL